jgi:hypothetical protein
MTLMHLYLVHRYKVDSVHYVSPTDDNHHQTANMKDLGIFSEVNTEVGEVIVADVDRKQPGSSQLRMRADACATCSPCRSAKGRLAPAGTIPWVDCECARRWCRCMF